jgi:hypothetical protein
MIFDALENLTVLRFVDSRSNKLWGRFQYGHKYYAFWGGMNQAMSFKSHGQWSWDLDKLADQKRNKGYKLLTVDDLVAENPQFPQTFSERFSWFVLSDNTP